jgi:hypothetical protein
MEKSVAHINLMKCPTTRDINEENQTDSSRLHNRAKGVDIVNTLLLREPTSNEMSLVFLIEPFGWCLVLKIHLLPKV